MPVCLDSYRHSQLPPPQLLRLSGTLKNLKQSNTSFSSTFFLADFTKEARHFHNVRFYSSSNRDAFKAEAPVGIFDEALSSFHLSSLGGRLGQSFYRLSRHINIYFKKKDVVAVMENGSFIVPAPEYLGRPLRRRHSQQSATEQNVSESKSMTQPMKRKGKQEKSGLSPSTQETSGLQLFHISSLTTRFGESYSYVANHINLVFSQGYTKVQKPENTETLSSSRGSNRKQKRRKVQSTAEPSEVGLNAEHTAAKPDNTSNSWEGGYLHFARHVNKYFGAKVTDGAQNKSEILHVEKNTYKKNCSTQPTSQTNRTTSQVKQEEPINPETGGLFHSSPNTANFEESYFQTSSHINQYFKKVGIDRDVPTKLDPRSPKTPEKLKTPSLMDCFRNPTSAIPDLLGGFLNLGPISQTTKPITVAPQGILSKKLVLSHRQAEETTRGLINSLGLAPSREALTACIEALNEHIIGYPSCKALIWQEKAAVTLLRQRRAYRHDQRLHAALREAMALIGFIDPVKGRGIRVLSVDGGGTRGVVPLQVLKLLEEETGRKIHELFDYICGVSTGAVLAFMLGLARFSLEECADMYRRFGSEVFRQNPLVGTVKMGWSHSYYNTETWERILQEKMGNRVLIKTARDEISPKVSAVSAVVNWGTSPKAFVFRNYNHKPGSLSRYAGGSGYQMWQAVRASSAAPGYFQEFPLQGDIHQDGGLILNNPCALAVHESRLLWPNQPFQCVLSLGTGRYDNVKRGPATSTSLRAKISNLICSATDTEGVHTLLDDLLAPDVYFRFNTMLSAEVSLDENRPRALDQLQRDTQNYLERNRLKLARLCLVLGAERSSVGRAKDWMSERAWEIKQRLM
ncbi:calcium-independent phospholipase A2-gamma-like [Melanotaenia boesemani]|uniref:calcium-independent phospholipase A2-gamma-like n=1 Tax=Melanotaenia boesemani TaxID=1250792 RepID=UPI001C056444|nr:calcium-independent phospholipase A2-gamma-like [Melanotaenia boesemani]